MDKLIRAINSVKNTRSFLDTLTQLFDFIEQVDIEDILEILRVTTHFIDSFNVTGLKFNGAIKHDGKHKAGRRITDRFTLTIRPDDFVDTFYTRLRHNGMIKADGLYKFGGWGRISDVFRINIGYGFEDKIEVTDIDGTILKTEITDYFPTRFRFDGRLKHDGKIKASASREILAIKIKSVDAFVDVFETKLRHNGMVKGDGSHKFNAKGKIADGFFIGMRRHHKHDGSYKANGKIKFNSGVLNPL